MLPSTFAQLAKVYLAQGGIGEADILVKFEYRPGCSSAHLIRALQHAERDIERGEAPAPTVVKHLRRVLINKTHLILIK